MDLGIKKKQRLETDALSRWIESTKDNYEFAQEFYHQKKQAFLQYLNLQDEKISNEIETELSDKFQAIWENGMIKALEEGVNQLLDDSNPAAIMANDINQTYNLQLNYKELLDMYSSNKKAQLGFEFEKVVAAILTDYFTKKTKQTSGVVDQQVNKLLTTFKEATGQEARSRAAHVKGAPLIRMDIGNMSLYRDEESKISYIEGSGGLTSELQSFIDVQAHRENNSFPLELQEYLAQGQFAGFSAKHMNKLMSEKFSQSSVITSNINEGLALPSSGGQRRRWQHHWAEGYANWYISKNLFNIIGPLDIGLVYGGGFQWMDTFLKSSRFRTRVKEDGGVSPTDATYAYRKVKSILYMTSAKSNGTNTSVTIAGSISGS